MPKPELVFDQEIDVVTPSGLSEEESALWTRSYLGASIDHDPVTARGIADTALNTAKRLVEFEQQEESMKEIMVLIDEESKSNEENSSQLSFEDWEKDYDEQYESDIKEIGLEMADWSREWRKWAVM